VGGIRTVDDGDQYSIELSAEVEATLVESGVDAADAVLDEFAAQQVAAAFRLVDGVRGVRAARVDLAVAQPVVGDVDRVSVAPLRLPPVNSLALDTRRRHVLLALEVKSLARPQIQLRHVRRIDDPAYARRARPSNNW